MELNKVLRRLQITGLLFVIILTIGSAVYYNIDPKATVVDAFYMTAITVSTIGFQEVIDLSNNPGGRLFTIALAFSGIGIITYFFSNLASLFIEGEIRRNYELKKMEKRINKLEGHYIVAGCGRVGRNIALELFQTEKEFVLADAKEDALEEFLNKGKVKGAPHLTGDCTSDDFLLKLGITRATGLFVTSGDDNTNLVITLSARTLSPAIKIVALSKSIGHVQKLKRAGADKVITPTFIGGLRMASEMIRPKVTTFLDDMLKTDLGQRIEELNVPDDHAGKLLSSLSIEDLSETMVLAINENDHWVYKPKPEHVLKKGSHLILMTTQREKRKLEDQFY